MFDRIYSNEVGLEPNYAVIATVGLTLTLGLVVLRVFSRLLMSNIHIYEESKTRRMMIDTFRSLLERGEIKSEDRILLLERVFTPISTGILKGEAVPPPIPEALLKRLMQK